MSLQKAVIAHSTDTEFETPLWLYKLACKRFNIYPQLDICATEQNTKCKKFFTKQQDAFYFEWKQDFWANIPFAPENAKKRSRGVWSWVWRIYCQHKKHDVSALVLLPLSSPIITDFSKYCEIWPISKRVEFRKEGKRTKHTISRDLMFLVFRSRQNIIDTFYSGLDFQKSTLKGGVFTI